jgi:hypothetical protein
LSEKKESRKRELAAHRLKAQTSAIKAQTAETVSFTR